MATSQHSHYKKPGFTLIELLVAMLISSILIGISTQVYSLFRRSMALDQNRADLSQNARITLDRLSRELRQATDVVTVLPADPSDTSVTQPGEIEFEDGHANDLSYRRYYIDQGTLKMQLKEYYFSYQTDVRVRWNSVGNANATPVVQVISTTDIADNVSQIEFYGDSMIEMLVVTSDGGNLSFPLRTVVAARNM